MMKHMLTLAFAVTLMTLIGACSNKPKDLTNDELKEKATQGDAQAYLKLAQRYEGGVKGLEKDLKQAFENYKKSAELGCIEAQYHLAKKNGFA